MSRYARGGEIQGYGARVKRYRAPAALPAFKYRISGGRKVVELYKGLHDAWRAGVIADFYYGKRSPQDPTIVWEVNGHEVTPDEARDYLDRYKATLGIESIEIGKPWCGYPSMTVTYADGSVLVDRYDGCARVESLTGPEKRAHGTDLFPELNGLATF